MTSYLLVLTVLAADPGPDQLKLLKTFRDEFVAIVPRDGNPPPDRNLQPFSIGKYEVPQNLWQTVTGNNPSRWKGPRNSVEMLSLDEARAFCRQATNLLRAARLIDAEQVIRLPTESEWEYAAQAGTTTKYSFGDDDKKLGDYAWFTGNAAGNDPAVGAKKPNPWGLYDMHGYLWEWTDSPSPAASAANQGTVRGGSWKDKASELTSVSRRVVSPNLRDDAIGLRCVLARDHALARDSARRSDPVLASDAASGRRQPSDNFATKSRLPAEFIPARQQSIVPPGATLKMLWDQGDFTEGPALAPDGSILFSDIGDSIWRYDPQTGKTALFRKPSGRANGLMFNEQGDLIACEGANAGGQRRISITTGIAGDKDGATRTLADRFEGQRFNSPNDLAIDAQGRVYFTDPRYVGGEPRELDFEAVFLVSPDGGVKIATREVGKPNGILVSPDGKTVYLSDNNPQGNRHLTAFTVKADGTLESKRVLHDFGAGRGIDGMAIDTAGNLYATAGTGDKAGVYVFDPQGAPLAFFRTPGDPTNCEFGGGNDGSTLYVTCANGKTADAKYGLYAIKLSATGHHVVKLK